MKRLVATVLIAAMALVSSVVASANQAVTVRVWFAGTSEPMMRVVNEQLLPAFHEAHPGIRVEVDYIPWGELSPKLLTSFAGNIAPDLFMHGQAATAGFASAGVLEPLDEYLAESPEMLEDFGASLDAGLYEGRRYMLPVYGSGSLLAYRTDFYAEAGLDPNAPPTTWEELRETALKLARKRGNRFEREGISIGISGTAAQQDWSPFLWQNGGDLFSEDGRQVLFDSQAGIEALEFYVSLFDEAIADTREAQALGNLPALAAGTVAQEFTNPENLKAIATYGPEVYPNIRVGQPLSRVQPAAWYSFAGFFMSKQSANKDAAWQVLQFFTSPEALELLTYSLSGLPPRASLAGVQHVAEDPNVVAFMQGLSAARFNPNVPVWVNARDALARQIERAVRGLVSPADALRAAANEVRQLLADQGN